MLLEQTDVTFSLTNGLNVEFLDSIVIRALDQEGSDNVEKQYQQSEISSQMDLELSGLKDKHNYIFQIEFNYDENKTYEPIITDNITEGSVVSPPGSNPVL
jgi:hypothetical protein